MAIDRTFGSALNKALRGLEQAGVGPLAEDDAWTPDVRLPRGRLRRRPRRRRADPLGRRGRPGVRIDPPRPAHRRADRPAPVPRPVRQPAVAAARPAPAGRARGRRPRGDRASRRGSSPRWAATSPSRPRSRRPGARIADADGRRGGRRSSPRSSGPGFGDRELAGLAGTTADEIRAARLDPRPAARATRWSTRAPPSSPPRRRTSTRPTPRPARRRRRRRSSVRRRSSSAPGRSGSGRGSSSTTAPSRPPTRSAAPAGAR